MDRPSLPVNSCARADPPSPMSVCSYMLDSPSLSRLIGIRQTLVQALRPSPSARRPSLHPENGKRVTLELLGGTCDLLGDSCGRPELSRRDADEALEVVGELALVREAGVRGDLHQGQVAAPLQELLGPFDSAQDDVLVRGKAGGRLELPREVVSAEAGDCRHLLQARVGVEVFLDVLDDGAEPCSGERAVPPARGLAGR